MIKYSQLFVVDSKELEYNGCGFPGKFGFCARSGPQFPGARESSFDFSKFRTIFFAKSILLTVHTNYLHPDYESDENEKPKGMKK